MLWRATRSTRTDTHFPYTTLVRSHDGRRAAVPVDPGGQHRRGRPCARVAHAPCHSPEPLGDRREQRGRDGRRGRHGWPVRRAADLGRTDRSEAHTSELQSLMRRSYAVFCLKKKTNKTYIKRI